MTSSNSSRHDGAKEEQQDGGDERASSASAGLLCLPRVDDDDGPMDTAEISAFLGRQELTKSAQMIDDPQPSSLVQSNSAAAECDDEEQSEVQTADVDGGPSASSTSAGLCRAEAHSLDDRNGMERRRPNESIHRPVHQRLLPLAGKVQSVRCDPLRQRPI